MPNAVFPTDAYFKKEVTFEYAGHTLRFRTSDALFSSHDIDDGTRLLLKTLTPEVIEGRSKVLDVGCGYGPLGIALAAAGAGEVEMVDRDALAVSYSEQNAALNDIYGVHAHGSLGYDDVGADYDLIVSNIPAKAGAPVIEHLLLDARWHLALGGLVAVVVIAPIAAEVEALLRSDVAVEVMFERRAPGYVVFNYRFSDGSRDARSGFARGLYEDEEPPPTSVLLLDALPDEGVRGAIVVNPTAALVQGMSAERVTIIGRDMLRLQTCARVSMGVRSTEYTVGVPTVEVDPAELAIATLIEDEGPAAHQEQVAALAGRLAAGGAMILAGSSTAITRIERFVRTSKLVRVEERKRKRGESVLILSSKK